MCVTEVPLTQLSPGLGKSHIPGLLAPNIIIELTATKKPCKALYFGDNPIIPQPAEYFKPEF
jgi:hypothetical protein